MRYRLKGGKVIRLKGRRVENSPRIFEFFTFSPSHLLTSRRGFTLIELLVSIGLFSVVVSIAVGGFVHALRTQRQAQLLLAANSNASAALEIMAREIRTGQNFKQSSASALTFTNANGKTVTYHLGSSGAIEKDENRLGEFQPITSSNVAVSNLSFLVQGVGAGDGYPPRITISFAVSPNSTDSAVSGSKVNLATTVSARLTDDQPATLVLQKAVVNTSAAGTAHASEFELVVRGNKVRPCVKVTLNDDHSGKFVGWCKFGGAAHDKDYPEDNSVKYFVYMAEGEYEADELPREGYEKQVFEIGEGVGCGGEGKTIKVNDVKKCLIRNTAKAPNPQP
jgi:prepilin-type N-terminal cleavage/methylation domain-containing protein